MFSQNFSIIKVDNEVRLLYFNGYLFSISYFCWLKFIWDCSLGVEEKKAVFFINFEVIIIIAIMEI